MSLVTDLRGFDMWRPAKALIWYPGRLGWCRSWCSRRSTPDKHKTVGLAGASLLQLAGSKAQAPPPSPKKPSSPDMKPPVKSGSSPAAKGEISPTRPAASTEEHGDDKMSFGGAVQGDEAPAREARATPTQRRASYAAPQKEVEPALTPKRRFTLPATPLPPLGSILERRPAGGLKRPREDGSKCLEDAPAQQHSPPPRSPSTPVDRDSSAPSHGPADPGKLVDAEEPSATYGVDPRAGPENDGGRGCPGSSPPAERLPGQDGLSRSCDASGGATASRPSAGAKRLFPGAWNEFQAWGPGPEGRSGSDQVGYLTKTLAPDWRKSGLESLGRAMSFDEALQAVGRDVLEPPQDGKPRRGSAFCVQAGIHPPVVTEVNRRDSALEPRPTPSRPPISHYSELLSAGQPFRSITAAHGGIPVHGQARPRLGADVEGEESLAKCSRGPFGHRRSRPGGGPADAPTRNDWGTRSGFADQPMRDASAAPSRASRLFHVMPAETPFTSGLRAPPGSRQEFRFRQDRAGPREGNTGSAEQIASVVGTMHGLGAEEQQQTGPASGEGGAPGGPAPQGRRWSVLDSSVPPPPVAEANNYVLAWGEGAQAQEEETDMTPPAASIPPSRGAPSRKPVFAGGGMGQADAEMVPRPPQPRRSSFAAASPEAEAMAGGMFRTRRQRWSPLDDVPDARENGASTPATYVAAWGAPASDEQGGRGLARDEDTAAIARVTDPYPGRSFGARRRGLFGAGCAGGGGGVGKGAGASVEMPLGRPPRGEPAHPAAAREGETMGPSSQRRGWLPSDQVSMPTDPPRSTTSFMRTWREEMNGGHKEERRAEVGSERPPRGEAEAAFVARSGGGSSRRGSLPHASSAVGNVGYAGMSGRHLHPG